MTPTLLAGSETSIQNTDNNVRGMDAAVYELEPDVAPLTVLLNAMGSVPSIAPKVEWLNTRPYVRVSAVSKPGYMLETLSIPRYYGMVTDTKPSENPSGAGNEQRRLAEAAWLAGLLDGDGWIGLIRAKRNGKDYYRYTASIALMSTSWANTEKSQAVLDSLGVNTYLAHYPAYVGKDGSPRRQKWTVSLRGNKDTATALRILRPYLAEKRTCADIVIEYVEWRNSYPTRPGGHAENVVRGMRERAEEAMRLLRNERNTPVRSETTRQALPEPGR